MEAAYDYNTPGHWHWHQDWRKCPTGLVSARTILAMDQAYTSEVIAYGQHITYNIIVPRVALTP